MKKKININTILIGAVAVLAVALLCWKNFGGTKGATALVRVDGQMNYQEISLEEDAVHYITTGKMKVTLEVKDGRIRFIDSVCPDHLCEEFGFISYEDETAICMPAGVAVLVSEPLQK